MVTVANMSIYTILGLMWKIFGAKCVKFVAFCILRSFTSTDADALSSIILTIMENPKIIFHVMLSRKP